VAGSVLHALRRAVEPPFRWRLPFPNWAFRMECISRNTYMQRFDLESFHLNIITRIQDAAHPISFTGPPIWQPASHVRKPPRSLEDVPWLAFRNRNIVIACMRLFDHESWRCIERFLAFLFGLSRSRGRPAARSRPFCQAKDHLWSLVSMWSP